MALSRTEIKAVAALLEDESNEELDSLQMAERVIQAIDEIREKSSRWVAVGRLTVKETRDHGPTHGLYVVGPFSTPLQAQRAGEGLWHDSRYWSSKGQWHRAPVVSKARSAWDAIKPKHKGRLEIIRQSLKEWEIRMHGEEWFAEKRGW